MKSFTLSADHPPIRLDKTLAQETGLGLRRCRDLIDRHLVTVDGRVMRKGDLVRAGQRVVLTSEPASDANAAFCPEITIVARDERFAALAKPGGLHTVVGREGACLEALLPSLGLAGWRLVNRLDQPTSGLVLAAASAEDEAAYKAWQNRGLIRKWYLALAHGAVGELELRGRILDAKRAVVRVTEENDDRARWTWVWPLAVVGDDTLVLVRILKGRRHQIRAHLAHAGHPLRGDCVHGQGETGGLFLHHWRVDMPAFSAAAPPAWAEVDPALLESAWSLATSLDS